MFFIVHYVHVVCRCATLSAARYLSHYVTLSAARYPCY